MNNLKLIVASSFLMLSACGGNVDNVIATGKSHQSVCTTTGSVIIPEYVRVIDGDTIEAFIPNGQSERVRLLGIDAPESDQGYGLESSNMLQQCIDRGRVVIEWNEKDRYGRLLGKVFADKLDCNLNQVKAGVAWHYKQYQSSQIEFDRFNYSNAEVIARTQKKGLWGTERFIAPWHFRRNESPNYHFTDVIYNLESMSCSLAGSSTEDHIVVFSDKYSSNPEDMSIKNNKMSQDASCLSMIEKSCNKMSSCDEAKQQLRCGNSFIDGDNDGVPCESICW